MTQSAARRPQPLELHELDQVVGGLAWHLTTEARKDQMDGLMEQIASGQEVDWAEARQEQDRIGREISEAARGMAAFEQLWSGNIMPTEFGSFRDREGNEVPMMEWLTGLGLTDHFDIILDRDDRPIHGPMDAGERQVVIEGLREYQKGLVYAYHTLGKLVAEHGS